MFELETGVKPCAWKAILYGSPGLGKTYLAHQIKGHAFIDLEQGTKQLDATRVPLGSVTNYSQFKDAVRFLIKQDQVTTIVIDTLDKLDQLVTQDVCEEYGKESMADFDWGKGYEAAKDVWRELIGIFNICNAKGKNVLGIAHEDIVTFNDPQTQSYDKYTIRLHRKYIDMVMAEFDAILFVNKEVVVKSRGGDKSGVEGKGKARALEGRAVVIGTTKDASYDAKNRFGLEPIEDMSVEIFNKMNKFTGGN